jgi:O-antigen ligase
VLEGEEGGGMSQLAPAEPDVARERRFWWQATPVAQATFLVQIYVITLFVFPTDMVYRPIGAQAFVAGLVSLFLFFTWATATLIAGHNPLRAHQPTRVALLLWIIATLLSWGAAFKRGDLDPTQRLAADRALFLLAGCTGVILVTAEGLSTMDAVWRVVRALAIAGAFCGGVAALQYWTPLDITALIRQYMPIFTVNSEYTTTTGRASLERVTGTTLHPIELGVVCGMLLPIVLTWAIHDDCWTRARRWMCAGLVAVGIPISVSRSALVSVGVALAFFVALLPVRQRLVALAVTPLPVVAVFMMTPGYIRTLSEFIGMGATDPSVTARTQDYPLAESLVRAHPWFGQGPGTYLPTNMLDIFDNQILSSAVELGLFGLAVLLILLVTGVVTPLVARSRTTDPAMRLLGAALAGSAAAAAVSTMTFDEFGFPTAQGLYSVVLGLGGALYVITQRDRERTDQVATVP